MFILTSLFIVSSSIFINNFWFRQKNQKDKKWSIAIFVKMVKTVLKPRRKLISNTLSSVIPLVPLYSLLFIPSPPLFLPVLDSYPLFLPFKDRQCVHSEPIEMEMNICVINLSKTALCHCGHVWEEYYGENHRLQKLSPTNRFFRIISLQLYIVNFIKNNNSIWTILF